MVTRRDSDARENVQESEGIIPRLERRRECGREDWSKGITAESRYMNGLYEVLDKGIAVYAGDYVYNGHILKQLFEAYIVVL